MSALEQENKAAFWLLWWPFIHPMSAGIPAVCWVSHFKQLHPVLQKEYIKRYNKIRAFLKITEVLSLWWGKHDQQCEEAAPLPTVLSGSPGEAFNSLWGWEAVNYLHPGRGALQSNLTNTITSRCMNPVREFVHLICSWAMMEERLGVGRLKSSPLPSLSNAALAACVCFKTMQLP